MGIVFEAQIVSCWNGFTSQGNSGPSNILKVFATFNPSESASPLVYLQVFDQLLNPSNGQQALFSKPFGPEGCVELDFGFAGRKFTAGGYAYFVLSSTPIVYTQVLSNITGFGLNALFNIQCT